MANVNQAEFEGKVAIVTGATSGIGRATATCWAVHTFLSVHFSDIPINILSSAMGVRAFNSLDWNHVF